MSLVVYKSSAGSGKTSTLVIEYLALALKNPKQFRQIIALTFTIKATSEMKERLIEYLIYLQKMDIKNIDKNYKHIVDKVEEITGFNKQKIKNNSIILLNRILHNYGDLGFNTIDSFVVSIVRSFAHDLQLSTNFEIELDKSTIINDALDKLFELIGSNKLITDFLVDFVLNQLDDEKSADIHEPLTKLAELTFESKHYANIEKLKSVSLKNFIEIKKIIKDEIKAFINTMSAYGQEGLDCITKFGLKKGDCSRNWLYNFFYYMKTGHNNIYSLNKIENSTFISFVDEGNNWYKKTQKTDIIELIDIAKPELEGIINRARQYYHNAIPYYNTYKLISKKITPLALIHIIKEIIYTNSLENDIVHLSEANRKIAEVIKNQHTPYIYERIGHQYSNYLIDEFQDTSVIQWNNILPLIDNSLANGKRCLLVGDAKQSIYRWRDGDVEQFVNLPKLNGDGDKRLLTERQNLLEKSIVFKNLDTNYRSLKNIIDFNNVLFSHLLQFEGEYVRNVFSDFLQKTPKTNNEGFIKLKNFNNDTNNEELLADILLQINELVENQNYNYGDICILARNKKVIGLIADFLLVNNIKILSSEALLLNKSKVITYIISMVNIIEEIDVSINSYIALDFLSELGLVTAKSNFISAKEFFIYLNQADINLNLSALRQLTIIEVVEKIIITTIPKNSKNAYTYRLLDIIIEQSQKIGNSLSAFLEYWNENNTNLSINIPETNDAIRLSTIHAAKGLEFPAVIFPTINLEEKLDGRDNLWIPTPEKLSDKVPVLLVENLSIGLKSTEKKIFEKEEHRKKLDSLNLFYVACTRPTEQLILYFSSKSKGKGLWNEKISNIPTINQEIESRTENEICIGSPFKHKANFAIYKKESNTIHTYIYEDWRNKIKIKTDYRPHSVEVKKHKGIQLHYLLSKLNTKSNITKLIDDSIMENNVSEEYKSEFNRLLHSLINDEKTKDIFDIKNKSLNEKEILTENNKIYRPDKVIYKNDEIWIIDFKYADISTISENELNKHKKQVKLYTNIIKEIEGNKTRGFLLYLQGLTRVFDINQ